MFQHILVPLDESAYAERALRYAEDLAKVGGGKVTLLVVVPRPHALSASEQAHMDAVTRLQQERPQRAEQYLAERAGELRGRGLANVGTIVHTGETADSITDVAREQGADLIAMSTHGLGASGRYALGSVALKVLMSAPCPVFMVRIQEAWSAAEA